MSQQSTYTDLETKSKTTSPAASPRTRHHSPGDRTLSNGAPQYSTYPQYYYAAPHYVGQFQPSPEAAPYVGASRPAPSIHTRQGGYSFMHEQAAQQYGRPPNQSTYSQPAHSQFSPSTHPRGNLSQNRSPRAQGEGKRYTERLRNLLQNHHRFDCDYLMEEGERDGIQWHRATFWFAGETFQRSSELPSKVEAREEAARHAFEVLSMLEPYRTRK